MIPLPSGVWVWLAAGVTDMRRGMNGLALQVQQALGRDQRSSPEGQSLKAIEGTGVISIFSGAAELTW